MKMKKNTLYVTCVHLSIIQKKPEKFQKKTGMTLHKISRFPLQIFSVNATKSAETADLVTLKKSVMENFIFCAVCAL